MHGALLALPFGLAIGLSLGLVGGGGSILAVPVLVYVIGEQVKQATTESLLIVGATASLESVSLRRGADSDRAPAEPTFQRYAGYIGQKVG